ncbi:MAG: F0F1 ATP synthase subunit A [Holosporales bacterium]|jgi:F-type H+-transporting ATPase subunit a|nr:F0F1 ATP synthase subunit A [Holosporales bacterium]
MLDPLSSFKIHVLIPIKVFGFDISVTNSSLFMIIATLLICVLLFVGTWNAYEPIPNKIHVCVEAFFSFVGSIVKSNINRKNLEIFPYMLVLFLFLVFGNVLGLFPFAFSFTTQIIVTMGMAMIVFLISVIIGFVNQGKQYFKHFCPDGIPLYIAPFFVVIETMSFLFRPLSLGLRLFANMVSGHIMIKVIASFAASIAGVTVVSYLSVIPIALNVFLNLFKLLVCVLQAYVFVVLSCIYISESLEHQNP